jgi:hypothetical protein
MLPLMLAVVLPVATPQQPVPLPQLPQLPAIAAGNASNLLRFVDFHTELAQPGAVAVVATLDRLKEGKRERLEGGTIGGGGIRISSSGTQYFKVSAKASLQVRVAFVGDPKGKLDCELELQLARLPDGSERRQVLAPNGAAIEPGMLALFVLQPPPAGQRGHKVPVLLHAIPFDDRIDTGANPRERFVDTMHDFVVINQRVRDLEAAIAALQGATDTADAAAARTALTALLTATVDLHQPEQRTLLMAQAGPWELRARELLAAAPGAAAPGGSGTDK